MRNQCCMTQWVEKVDIHAYETLSSGLQEASHWPKMVFSRSNCLKLQTFSGGTYPQTPLAVACLLIKNLTTQNLVATVVCTV